MHVDLDGAWPRDAAGVEYFDAGEWGPRLRFTAPAREMEGFFAAVQPRLGRFTLFGSGDFHHLSGLWLRRFGESLTLVSFDNHPDWDIRPPRWGCGGWLKRALALPQVRRAVVWGCGNFEFDWPHRLFANHRALRAGRLVVHPWTERLRPAARTRWGSVSRDGWREKFTAFAASLAGERLYVTIDTDCLTTDEAVTNWEQGLFTPVDVAWALCELRAHGAEIAGGDLCGAWSEPRYARWKQRFAANFDRPRLGVVDPARARDVNLRSLATLWPALTGA